MNGGVSDLNPEADLTRSVCCRHSSRLREVTLALASWAEVREDLCL